METASYEQRIFIAGALHGIFGAWHRLSRLRPELTQDRTGDALLRAHTQYLDAFLVAVTQLPAAPETEEARTVLHTMMESRIREIRATLDEREEDAKVADEQAHAALTQFTDALDRLLSSPRSPQAGDS
jgi:hypothetical protein